MDGTINNRTRYYDTNYLGHEALIATGVLETDAGLLLVDPGPTVALETLEEKLAADGADWDDVHGLLLTHIHLDHAGATGTILKHVPHVQVYVHEFGAPHMVRPQKLLASARRIYGDKMDDLWGDFLPVPEENVTVLAGGESLEIGGRSFAVAYTPGHAKHHVSYLDESSGTAFIGDVGGMRVAGSDFLIPVMPPPDVDMPAWQESLEQVRTWGPDRIFLTHFGPHADVDDHLDRMSALTVEFAETVRHTLDDADQHSDEEIAQRFAEKHLARMRTAVNDETLRTAYTQFGQPRDSWYGLARYWRKKAQAGT